MFSSMYLHHILSGLRKCVNHLLLLLFSPYFTAILGGSNDGMAWLNGNPRCLKCGGVIQKCSGLICANYGTNSNPFRLKYYKSAYHGIVITNISRIFFLSSNPKILMGPWWMSLNWRMIMRVRDSRPLKMEIIL